MMYRNVDLMDYRRLFLVFLFIAVLKADPIQQVAPPGVLYEMLALTRDLPTLNKPKYNSPCAMVASSDGAFLYIAQQTAKRIDVFDIAGKVIIRKINLPDEITGLAIASDDATLYATCSSERWPAGKVCVVDIAAGKVTALIPAGWGSCAPVVHPSGSKLYVCNRFGNDVSVIDLTSKTESKRIPVSREPCCAAITPDGATLVVGNALPDHLSTDTSYIGSVISLINVNSGTLKKNIPLIRGSKNVHDVAISADGKYAFVTHLIGKFNLIAATVANGWLTTNNLAVIDLENQQFLNTISLDHATIGMGNPWGVRCSDDGKFLTVAHSGSGELSIIRYQPFIDTVLARTARGKDMQKDFTSMLKSRSRVKVAMKSPRVLTITGSTLYTAGYFSDSLMQIKLPDGPTNSLGRTEYSMLSEGQPLTAERKGETFFYDASLCYQKWLSCHSCHPSGRTDGLNWILGGGAVTTPKNNRGLLYSWWTPPTTWTGRRGHAEESIKAAIMLELFQSPTDSIALPLDTFCMNLKPVQSPYRIQGRLSEAAVRGKALFNDNEVKCFTCHKGSVFADELVHASPIEDPFDATTDYNTPTLVEVWRSKPYGHIGSVGTIHEMIERYMQKYSRTLSPSEIDELAEYVLSL